MALCEDFPCCGHERGCCPDFDDSGKQLNMKCVCGATLPINSRSSLCASCLHDPECMSCSYCEREDYDDDYCDEDEDE